MVFIWRGIGIVVPIIIFIVGWFVSLFFEDTRLGNGSFMGWVFFYSAIVFLIIGLLMLKIKKQKKTEGTESWTLRKHDFFFIPILFWAPILLVLSLFLIFSSVKKEPEFVDFSEDLTEDSLRE